MITVLSTSVCWLLAGVFGLAAHHKLEQGARFRAALAAYDVVPDRLLGVAAPLVISLELATAAGLLILLPAALAAAAVLLTAYAAIIAWHLSQGRRLLDCGCGDRPTPISWAMVWRNVLLAGAALLAAPSTRMGLEPTTLALALLTTVTVLLIYLAADQLIANQSRIAQGGAR